MSVDRLLFRTEMNSRRRGLYRGEYDSETGARRLSRTVEVREMVADAADVISGFVITTVKH